MPNQFIVVLMSRSVNLISRLEFSSLIHGWTKAVMITRPKQSFIVLQLYWKSLFISWYGSPELLTLQELLSIVLLHVHSGFHSLLALSLSPLCCYTPRGKATNEPGPTHPGVTRLNWNLSLRCNNPLAIPFRHLFTCFCNVCNFRF